MVPIGLAVPAGSASGLGKRTESNPGTAPQADSTGTGRRKGVAVAMVNLRYDHALPAFDSVAIQDSTDSLMPPE